MKIRTDFIIDARTVLGLEQTISFEKDKCANQIGQKITERFQFVEEQSQRHQHLELYVFSSPDWKYFVNTLFKVAGKSTALSMLSQLDINPVPQDDNSAEPLEHFGPPIGLRPEFIWVEHRIDEIDAACNRYWKNEKLSLEQQTVCFIWLKERAKHVAWLQDNMPLSPHIHKLTFDIF